jgi:glycerophosphoryl diester phosphodiesterase
MTPPPRISWHRGGAELAPYATLGAFSSAAAHGAELIEVDVRRSADGVMVCAHDPVVRGLGRLDRLSWAELSEQRPGVAQVVSFTELLDALDTADPGRRSQVHLDLKEAGFEAEAVAAVLVPFSDLEECGATGVAAHFLLATPLLRRWCTRRGMQLLVWTVDGDAALARWLARADVDVVTTNRPLAALSIRERLAPGGTVSRHEGVS